MCLRLLSQNNQKCHRHSFAALWARHSSFFKLRTKIPTKLPPPLMGAGRALHTREASWSMEFSELTGYDRDVS